MLGKMLGNIRVKVSADISSLLSSLNLATTSTQAASNHMVRSWAQTGSAAAAAANQVGVATKRGSVALDQFGRSFGMARANVANLGYQLNDIGVSLAGGQNPLMVLVQQGSQIQQIYGGNGGVKALFYDLGKSVAAVARHGKGPLAIAGGFALLQDEIKKSTKESVSFMDTVVATFQVGFEAIRDLAKDALSPLTPYFNEITTDLSAAFKRDFNLVVGLAVGTFKAVQEVWRDLPTVFWEVLRRVVGEVRVGFTQVANTVIVTYNELADKVNNNFGASLGRISEIPIETPPLQITATLDSIEKVKEAFREAMGEDYAGDAFDAISKRAVELSKKKDDDDKDSKTKKKVKEMEDELRKASDNVGEAFGNMFGDIMRDGKITFESLRAHITDVFINSISRTIEMTISDALYAGLSSMGGGAQGTFISMFGNGIAGLFGAGASAPLTSPIPIARPAAGGGLRMPGDLFLAGELGPEMVSQQGPSAARSVTTARQTEDLLAGSKGGTQVFNLSFPNANKPEDFRRSVPSAARALAAAVDASRRFS